MPQYYTLEEAARILGTTPEEVKKMAERNEVRPFRDRGNLRFRAPEVEELARRMGRGSDPDLQFSDQGRSRTPAAGAPSSQKLSQPPADDEGGVFDFPLDPGESDVVEIGQELPSQSPGGRSKTGGSSAKIGGPKSPPPKAGSDSDVRLVPDGSNLSFEVADDSDVKIVSDSPSSSGLGKPKTPKPRAPDSGVKVVPLDTQSDSDVKMVSEPDSAVPIGKPGKTPSDSDVRLEPSDAGKQKGDSKKGKKGEQDLTEDIDLDA